MNKSRLDLNLLVVFDAVARCGSVSIAAKSLSLSQPAVSHALNRLRDQLDDRLFERNRHGLIPTPRAQAMIGPVRQLLQSASNLLSNNTFDPLLDARRFRIGASEYSHSIIIPALITRCRELAPNVSFEFLAAGAETLGQLERGDLDCSFWGLDRPEGRWCSASLFKERFVGLVARTHPLAGKRVSIDQYLAYPHVSVSLSAPGRNPIDKAVERMGIVRNVVASSQSFATALASLPDTDLIATLPSRLITRSVRRLVSTFDLPLPRMEYEYALLWHERADRDPALAWLRGVMAEEAAQAPK